MRTGYLRDRPLAEHEAHVVFVGTLPGRLHALTGQGKALCLERHFQTNPYAGGTSKGHVIETIDEGTVDCQYCLAEL